MPTFNRDSGERSTPGWVLVSRIVVAVLLVPLGVYLVPRVIALVQIPTAFQKSLDNGHAYNPRIVAIVDHERNTVAALNSLDRIDAALSRVRRTDAQVAEQLRILVGQIRGGVQPVLNRTNGEVGDLLAALDDLETALTGLSAPVADIRHTVAGDRKELQRILTQTQRLADQVWRARESSGSAADNVTGPGR